MAKKLLGKQTIQTKRGFIVEANFRVQQKGYLDLRRGLFFPLGTGTLTFLRVRTGRLDRSF